MSDDQLNTVVFIDDDFHIRISMEQTLELSGYIPQCTSNVDKALENIGFDWPGILITDINMSPVDGMEVLKRAHTIDDAIPVIMVTGHGDVSLAVSAMKQGAYDFIEKPFDQEKLLEIISRAFEKRALILENRKLRQQLKDQDVPGVRILGNTQPMQVLRNRIQRVVNAPADILIHGDTGTGKELVARYLHEHSDRRKHPFVAINCGAVPENLIESELFGHEAGAFTSAEKRRVGKFEHANGGTLFLDEIESMPMLLQVKLLRVLEERKIERLGSNTLIDLNIRVLAATKDDLLQRVEEGGFRRDLYYRLNVITLKLPALKERKKDILLLFEHFALIASARYGCEYNQISPVFSNELLSHDWPGNVRELRNSAERYVLTGGLTGINDQDEVLETVSESPFLSDKLDQFEKALIEQTLGYCAGSLKDTQLQLGIARKTLYEKMKKHGLDKSDFRP